MDIRENDNNDEPYPCESGGVRLFYMCLSCVNCSGIFNRMQFLRLLVLRHVLQTVTIYAKNIARWAGTAGPVKHIRNQFHHGPFLIVKLILLINCFA